MPKQTPKQPKKFDNAPPEMLLPDFDALELPKILPPMSDIVFKMLFGDENNKDILIDLLNAVLRKNIKDIKILDPNLKPHRRDGKTSVLDVKAELDNKEKVNIEIQVRSHDGMRSRVMQYVSSMTAEQLDSGKDYFDIKPVISIIIVGYPFIHESDKCHNVFLMLEKDEHFPFSNLQEIHVLHLCRIDREKMADVSDWLSFIRSNKEEDFMVLAKKRKAIGQAYERLKVISANEENRILYAARLREELDQRAFERTAVRIERELWQGVVAEKDTALAEKDALIAKLMAQIGDGKG